MQKCSVCMSTSICRGLASILKDEIQTALVVFWLITWCSSCILVHNTSLERESMEIHILALVFWIASIIWLCGWWCTSYSNSLLTFFMNYLCTWHTTEKKGEVKNHLLMIVLNSIVDLVLNLGIYYLYYLIHTSQLIYY